MLHNIIRRVALLALGVCAAGSVNALGFGAKILADNEVSAWQLISHGDTPSIVMSGDTPTAQLGTPAMMSFSNLDAGDYSLVFAITNWTSEFDHTPGPVNTHPGNAVGFLGYIDEVDSDSAITGLNGDNPLVSDASWDSNLGNAIPSIADAIAAPGSAGWSDTSEVIAGWGEGEFWEDRPHYNWTGFSPDTNWIWAAGDTDGQVLLRTQFNLAAVGVAAVPIPAAGILFFSAITGLLTLRRRRNAASEA